MIRLYRRDEFIRGILDNHLMTVNITLTIMGQLLI